MHRGRNDMPADDKRLISHRTNEGRVSVRSLAGSTNLELTRCQQLSPRSKRFSLAITDCMRIRSIAASAPVSGSDGLLLLARLTVIITKITLYDMI